MFRVVTSCDDRVGLRLPVVYRQARTQAEQWRPGQSASAALWQSGDHDFNEL
jgi:hypothetical protein